MVHGTELFFPAGVVGAACKTVGAAPWILAGQCRVDWGTYQAFPFDTSLDTWVSVCVCA